jgi:hypothetical protein
VGDRRQPRQVRCTNGREGCEALVSSLEGTCTACLADARRRLLEDLAPHALAQHDATHQALTERAAPRRSPRASAPQAKPSKLPQTCPPPLGVSMPSREQVAQAERVARASMLRAFPADANVREVVYWAPWVRPWFRRGVQSAEQAGRELANLPAWWAAKVRETAKHNGYLRTSAGRHVVMYAALVYWHARQGHNVISGLSQEAWASLSLGTRADEAHRHYSTEYLFHPIHDGQGPKHPEKRGPRGGSIGAGNNCGLVRQLERDGVVDFIQPDGRAGLPAWMVGRRGWAFGQAIAATPVDEPDDTDRSAQHAHQLEVLGTRIIGPS